MNCNSCNQRMECSKTNPFEGFLCANGHMQCGQCDTKYNKCCGICGDESECVILVPKAYFKEHTGIEPASVAPDEADIIHVRSFEPSAPDEINVQSSTEIHQQAQQKHLEQQQLEQQQLQQQQLEQQKLLQQQLQQLQLEQQQLQKQQLQQQQIQHQQPYANTKDSQKQPRCAEEIGDTGPVDKKTYNKEKFDFVVSALARLLTEAFADSDTYSGCSKASKGIQTENYTIPHSMEPEKCQQINATVRPKVMPDNSNNPDSNNYKTNTNYNNTHYVENTPPTSNDKLSTAPSVIHYLWTHEPLLSLNDSNYRCQLANYIFNRNRDIGADLPMQMQANIPTTESASSITTVQLDLPLGLHSKFQPREYVVMQAAGMRHQVPKIAKDIKDEKDKNRDHTGLDVRLHKILKTFTENADIPKSAEKTDLEKDLSIKPAESVAKATAKQQKKQEAQKTTFTSPQTNKAFNEMQHFHIHRALYRPAEGLVSLVRSSDNLPTTYSVKEPPVQYERMTRKLTAREAPMVTKELRHSVDEACTLVSCRPMQCPDSKCKMMMFLNDFRQHYVSNHIQLTKERLRQHQCKNFVIDPGMRYGGHNSCHYLFFLMDSTKTFTDDSNFLPLIVMSSRIAIDSGAGKPPYKLLIIWVTGVIAKNIPIHVTLSVLPRTGRVPNCHMGYSGQVYDIRKSQEPMDVFNSGKALTIAPHEIRILSCKYTEMLTVQLTAEIGEKLRA